MVLEVSTGDELFSDSVRSSKHGHARRDKVVRYAVRITPTQVHVYRFGGLGRSQRIDKRQRSAVAKALRDLGFAGYVPVLPFSTKSETT
jgi:hypothetical protein